MPRSVTATEARIHFGELMRHVVETDDPVVVERAGRRQIVLISVPEYERLCAGQSGERDWRALLSQAHERIRLDLAGRELPPAEDVIREMREERDAQLMDLR